MPGIYISGGSGLGKTHCVDKILKESGVWEKVTEWNLPILDTDGFWDHDFMTRQTALILNFSKLHFTERPVIADRSVLDYLVWSKIAPSVAYKGMWPIPDLQIIVPTPSVFWFNNWVKEWKKKTHRLRMYMERFTQVTDLSVKVSDSDLAEQVWAETKTMEEQLARWCTLLEWPYFCPHISSAIDTYHWQWQEGVIQYMKQEKLI